LTSSASALAAGFGRLPARPARQASTALGLSKPSSRLAVRNNLSGQTLVGASATIENIDPHEPIEFVVSTPALDVIIASEAIYLVAASAADQCIAEDAAQDVVPSTREPIARTRC
jgi:hypothetical protein